MKNIVLSVGLLVTCTYAQAQQLSNRSEGEKPCLSPPLQEYCCKNKSV